MLGLDRARAIGLSSHENDSLFHNRGFIYAGRREGLLRVLGGEPEDFGIVDIAPAASDLVWRQGLDVDALLEVIRGLSELGVGLSPDALENALDQPLLTLDVTLRSVLEGLATELGVVLSLEEGQNMRVPGESFVFPYTDFLVSASGVEAVADAIVRYAASEPLIRVTQSDGWTIVSPAIRLPPPWNAYEPSVIKETETGKVYLVSSPSFLERCLATTDAGGVASTPEFARAMDGLPDAGSGLLYLSPKMTRAMHAALDQVVAANGPAVQTHVGPLSPAPGGRDLWMGAS